jgi:hypothetical protein
MGELGIAIEVSELSAATKKVFQDEGEWMAKVRVGGDTPTKHLLTQDVLDLTGDRAENARTKPRDSNADQDQDEHDRKNRELPCLR